MSTTGILPTYQRFVNGVPVPFSRRSCRAREKYVIFLVFITFGLVCFGTFFYLPEFRTGGTAESVYKVYDQIKRAGPELLIPPPPHLEDSREAPKLLRHEEDFREDPHVVGDRAKLKAKIEQDGELKVLERPDLVIPKTSTVKQKNIVSQLDENVGAEDFGIDKILTVPPAPSQHHPLTRGGEDKDRTAKERREKVKEKMVSNIVQSYTIKMEVPENKINEFDVTLEDFPFICRACFSRSDLRLFEEEDFLWDLFLLLTKVEDHSSANFPRNICDSCIITLEDISLFIDISKFNNAIYLEKMNSISLERRTVRMLEDANEKERTTYCRGCLRTSNLSPFEEKYTLLQLFQECTAIDISYYGGIYSICDKCTDELKKASSFISFSVRNNGILQRLTAVGTTTIKNEDVFDDSSDEPERCEDLHTSINIKQESFSINIKQEALDIISACSNSRSEVVPFDQVYPEEKSPVKILAQTIKTDPQKSPGHLSEERRVSSPTQSLECNNSEKSFCRNYLLQRYTHTGGKPHTCEYCGKIFSLETNLKRHLLICSGRVSMQRENLQRHSVMHIEDNPFKCDGCVYTSKWKHNLDRHTLRTHTKREKSTVCDKKFREECHLKRQSEDGPIECDDKTKWTLKCSTCEKTFRSAALLKQHLPNHSEERPFSCKYCNFSTKWAHSLQRHRLVCSKGKSKHEVFAQQYLTVKTGKAPKCPVCKKTFRSVFLLKQHLPTHSEERPFECKSCGFSTKYGRSLQRHRVACSKIFNCNIYAEAFVRLY